MEEMGDLKQLKREGNNVKYMTISFSVYLGRAVSARDRNENVIIGR